jgi:tetraacyldisaccharide 4'-kinase
LPVICIGNFTAGGTGKTPLVINLLETLKSQGHVPVALTRGYSGRVKGPYWVNANTDLASDVGDEALLIARSGHVNLARNRAAGIRAIETGRHAATVIIMDDGLQNPAVTKDLTIAVVDGSRGLGNGRVIPAGPLRAPLEFQLELTDVILITGTENVLDSPIAAWLRHRFQGPVLSAMIVPLPGTEWLNGARVVAWAGIGAPRRFMALLEQLGAIITNRITFPDHYCPTAQDAQHLLRLAHRSDALLVTTEKDVARLRGVVGPVSELAAASRPVPVKLQLAASDQDRFASLIETGLIGASS